MLAWLERHQVVGCAGLKKPDPRLTESSVGGLNLDCKKQAIVIILVPPYEQRNIIFLFDERDPTLSN